MAFFIDARRVLMSHRCRYRYFLTHTMRFVEFSYDEDLGILN